MPLNQTTGSRAQVMHGNAKKTSGGLTKAQLKYNKQGKIVSRKASTLATKNNRLVKAGYVTRKGQFGVSMKGGVLNTNRQKKIEGLVRGLPQREREYVNARQARFYRLTGETRLFPVKSVSNTLPALMVWLDAPRVSVFIKDTEIALKGADTLEADKEYFVLPRDPILDKHLLDASLAGNEVEVRDLLDQGVDANVVDEDKGNATPLHYASQKGHTAVVELLLAAGADVTAVSGFNMTALHFASLNGHKAVVKLLLAAGADVHAVSIGRTPLHLASQKGHGAVAELLLTAGADVTAVNRSNMTPLQFATQKGHEAVANLIREHVANQSK